jgi:hypothetical protein
MTTTAPSTSTAGHLGKRLYAGLLVTLMAVGSAAMWVGSPLGWLWIASQIVDTKLPTASGYLAFGAGLVVTTIVLGRALASLDRRHRALTGDPVRGPVRVPWNESATGGRPAADRGGVLDSVMVVSVALALVGVAAWFLLFAGSPLPG